MSIACSGTSKIIISSAVCSMKIKAQTTGGKARYTTVLSTPDHVEIASEVTNVKVEEKTGPLCSLLGTEGSYSGSFTVKAFAGLTPVAFDWL